MSYPDLVSELIRDTMAKHAAALTEAMQDPKIKALLDLGYRYQTQVVMPEQLDDQRITLIANLVPPPPHKPHPGNGLPPITALDALDLTEDERRDLAFRAWNNAHTEEDLRWQPHPEPDRRPERAARWRQIANALHPAIMGYPNGENPL
jgi:hypothetical protein